MNNWGIRKQVMILALLPALAVGIILSGYFTYAQISYISDTLKEHGRSTVSQIAPSAEYAVFSGNAQSLRRALTNTLKQDKQIVRITIYNADNIALLNVTDDPQIDRYPEFAEIILSGVKQLDFRAPITMQELAVSDFDDNLMLNTGESREQQRTIGYAELTLTTYYSNQQKIEALLEGGLLTLAILLLSGLIALRLSKQIAQPVQLMTSAVRKIAAGDYATQIRQDAPGELAILEECVNTMAEELRIAQNDMESRINEFTLELQQTLEELEIRNAELDITRSNAMQASQAKSEFLANMSHEIRTPLSGILGFAELLTHTGLDPQQRDYADTILKSARNLLMIIDDILDLSKIESGKLDITRSDMHVLDIIEDVVDLLAPSAYERNIELFYRVDADVPLDIQSDPIRMRQVLLNLVGNAVKFTEQGYVDLHVQFSGTHKEPIIKFTISDTGIGMSPDNKQRLFTAFTQADTSITRRFGGTGLGLVISRKLVMLMNGEIGFDSTEGEGSTFWFEIPVSIQPQRIDSEPDILSGSRIALIEEQRLCREALRSMLQQWGCRVTELRLDHLRDDRLPEQARDFDAIVIGVSRKHLRLIHNYAPLVTGLNRQGLPTLMIASTRTQTDVDVIRPGPMNQSVFRTARQAAIRNALTALVGRCETARSDQQAKTLRPPEQLPVLRILVVDDNDINLRLAEIILSKQGLNVATASSGEDSIELFRQSRFDIVFMDLHMPGLDGYETARRIREFEDEVDTRPVIIALTANAMKQEIEKVQDAGMDDLVIKPISENLIQDVIKKWYPRTVGERAMVSSPDNSAPLPHVTANDDAFSIEVATRLTNGNTQLAIELFSMLRKELPLHRSAIENALGSDNRSELKEHTHKLNGASRYCGTPAMLSAANALEHAIDNERITDITRLGEALLEEIDRVLQYPLDECRLQAVHADSSTTTATE